MAWYYSQKTGELKLESELVGVGYSGAGKSLASGRNNPNMETVKNKGPIPRGQWMIGPAFHHAKKGPVCMRLEPVGHNMAGRDGGFMIHGNNTNDASEGCIILAHFTRIEVRHAPPPHPTHRRQHPHRQGDSLVVPQ